jgi:hypothetical protein
MTIKLRASTFKVLTNEEWEPFRKVVVEHEKQVRNEMIKSRKGFGRFHKS